MKNNSSQSLGDIGSTLGILTKSHSAIDQKRVTDYLLQDQASKLLPYKFRVKYCLKRKINKSELRNVCWNESTKKAHFGNVVRCGSVWVCPVCAKKITEKRRSELAQINERWKNGITLYHQQEVPKELKNAFVYPPRFVEEHVTGYTYLVTLTTPHYAVNRLTGLKEKLKGAMKNFFSNRKGRYIFDNLMGKRFHITNYEVTYGKNGWHPHHHILIFSDKYLSIHEFSNLHDIMCDHWANCLSSVGIRKLKDNEKQIACDFQDGTFADQYVGKWGIEHEMTKGHVKQGNKSYTPFDLLRLSELDQPIKVVVGKDDLGNEIEEDRLPSKLFQEFAISFKGARQLMFSRGLKHAFSVKDIADEEIADSTLDEAEFLTDIEDTVFYLLCKFKKRATYLDAVTADKLSGNLSGGLTDQLINQLIEYELVVMEERIAKGDDISKDYKLANQ